MPIHNLNDFELDFLIDEARKNRDNSQALSELPGQRWAKLHASEVCLMNTLLEKLEHMKDELYS